MNKLTQPKQHLFLDEAGEYLEAHGFKRAESHVQPGAAIYFMNGRTAVEIRGDKMIVAVYHPGDEDRNGEYKDVHTFTGIGQLDLFGYMLFFHITGVASIRSLAKGAMQQGVRFSPEDVLREIFRHHKVTDDREAVPINY